MAGRTSSLTDYLNPDTILCDMPCGSSEVAIRALVDRLHEIEGGFDRDVSLRAVLQREAVEPTVIAPGLALPHARLDHVDRLHVAIGICPEGIDFGGGEDPVRLIVLVITPAADPSSYLRIVASISRLLGEESTRDRLARCGDADMVFRFLSEGDVQLPLILTARDVMNASPVTILESDTLAAAIQSFFTHRVSDLPVVDEEQDLRGVISVEDVLRLSLPQHLLWMEDLSPIVDFQPFAELLRKDKETRIADFMREDTVTIAPSTPAIQLAKMFLVRDVRLIHVVEGRRLAGVVGLDAFVSRLVWA
jgi:nitrogen PTS system EIIA component